MAFGKKKKEEEIIINGSSIIERGIEVYGEKIIGSTNIIIRGIVNSQIELDADIILEHEGIINGDLHARNCKIKGRIVGNIFVSGHLHITEEGHVTGDISCTTLEVDSGGVFVGTCNKQSNPIVTRERYTPEIYETEGMENENDVTDIRMIGRKKV